MSLQVDLDSIGQTETGFGIEDVGVANAVHIDELPGIAGGGDAANLVLEMEHLMRKRKAGHPAGLV